MVNIHGKEWRNLTGEDIEEFLASPETEESFFFEFKDDRVKTKKFAEEISALANTYGGYIFLGVSDSKEIKGCEAWNEQRIQTTIHDSITPTPSFDIRKFICSGQSIYVIRIDEGTEPPYITSQGQIFERIASGSCYVRDSMRLSQMRYKHDQQMKIIEETITIPSITSEPKNVYGYIDIGFSLTLSDRQLAIKTCEELDLRKVAQDEIKTSPSFNLFHVGNSIVYSPGGLSSSASNKLPAHLNNFIEIMCDGSARMRVLLFNNNPDETSVNMIYPFHYVNSFRVLYGRVFGPLFPDAFIYARKYESLTVLKQFQPIFLYEPNMTQDFPALIEQNKKYQINLREKRSVLGIDNVITNDRIPKTGLNVVDKKWMEKYKIEEYTRESILEELFYSQFVSMSFPYEAENITT